MVHKYVFFKIVHQTKPLRPEWISLDKTSFLRASFTNLHLLFVTYYVKDWDIMRSQGSRISLWNMQGPHGKENFNYMIKNYFLVSAKKWEWLITSQLVKEEREE